MKPIRNHYDNLKVSRNAPAEVIRAAYKALAQKYHPDRNSSNVQASKNMAIINESYNVLSNPIKRKEHDLWIVNQEPGNAKKSTNNENLNTSKAPKISSDSEYFVKIFLHVARHWVLYGIATFLIFLNLSKSPSPHQKPYSPDPTAETEVSPETSEPAPPAEEYTEAEIPAVGEVESTTESNAGLYSKAFESLPITEIKNQLINAPNGEAWPTTAGYVKGYKKLNTKGLSTVTVDNSQNNSNVFVKLVSLSSAKSFPARQFFIPANSKFTVKKVTSGDYDVRYRDLSDGGLLRSETFSLKETKTGNGVQFSNITMTLYKTQNGNMQTFGMSESEF